MRKRDGDGEIPGEKWRVENENEGENNDKKRMRQLNPVRKNEKIDRVENR